MRALFEDSPVELEFARGHNPFRFDSAEHFMVFFETHYGPTLKARERLTAEGRWEDCRSEIVEMAERRNEATDGSLADARRVPRRPGPQGRLAWTHGPCNRHELGGN